MKLGPHASAKDVRIMTPDDFRNNLDQFLHTSPAGLTVQIPAGSGLCHIANTTADAWKGDYVSANPGRWTQGGQPRKYFAQEIPQCAAELGYEPGNPPRGKVVELWETTLEIEAIDVSKLPKDLCDALFEDKGVPSIKWQKPHMFIEEVTKRQEYQHIKCIYAPSASGASLGLGGMCLVVDPNTGVARRLKAQTYEEWERESGVSGLLPPPPQVRAAWP